VRWFNRQTKYVRGGPQVIAQAVSPEFFAIKDLAVTKGRLISEQEAQLGSPVVVIGSEVADLYFPNLDPIGRELKFDGLPFRVIGVLQPKGTTAGMGQDQDDQVFIPLSTLQRKVTGDTWLRFIMVSAVSLDASTEAQRQIESLLRERHRIRAGMDDDFFVRNMKDVADTAAQSSQVMTILLASIASVSLLVGGIGIMNIMLVSVTERTREIGIRIAIGATEEDVQRQFLIEAFVLSVIGGAVGILLGMIASYVISHQFKWPVLISPTSILVAAFFSMAIGIFFGYYPARKASRLDPIDALRYE
jgi:putative ABC transport system permease protein